MHPSFAQKVAVLEALRLRSAAARSEFYAKTQRLEPIRLPRFNVIPSGNNQFGIVERDSGTVHHVCTGHGAACRAAQRLEEQPARQPSIATLMLRWTFGIAVILALFAAYGAHP